VGVLNFIMRLGETKNRYQHSDGLASIFAKSYKDAYVLMASIQNIERRISA